MKILFLMKMEFVIIGNTFDSHIYPKWKHNIENNKFDLILDKIKKNQKGIMIAVIGVSGV